MSSVHIRHSYEGIRMFVVRFLRRRALNHPNHKLPLKANVVKFIHFIVGRSMQELKPDIKFVI